MIEELAPELELELLHNLQQSGVMSNPHYFKFTEDEILIRLFSNKFYLIGYSIDKKDTDYTYIRSLYVPDKYRNQMFGSKVVSKIKKECLKKNIHRLEIEATESSYKFWEKLGFKDMKHENELRMYLKF